MFFQCGRGSPDTLGVPCGSQRKDKSWGMGSMPMPSSDWGNERTRDWTGKRQVTGAAPPSLGEASGSIWLVGISVWFLAVWCGQISQPPCISVTSAVSGGAHVRVSEMTCSQGCGRSRRSINALPSTHLLCSYSPAPLSVNIVSVAGSEKSGRRFSPVKCDFMTKRSSAPLSPEIPPCNHYLTAEVRDKENFH